ALRGLARVEDALLLAAHSTQSRVNWASIAADAGYADQSHLCRELRRYTGFSPRQLSRCVPNQEDLWVYQAWFGWSGARNDMPDPSDALRQDRLRPRSGTSAALRPCRRFRTSRPSATHGIRGRVSNVWNGGGEGSVHSSVVAPAPQGLPCAGT